MQIGLLTKHWPKDNLDPSGVFVKRWAERMDAEVERGWKAAWKADVIAAHWLWPSGLVGGLISLVRRKPFWLVLHGDPFMLDRYWWVRVVAWQAIHRASVVQVVSKHCEGIMRRRYPHAKIVRIPCL